MASWIPAFAGMTEMTYWIPAFAGMTEMTYWIPAFAGMTDLGVGGLELRALRGDRSLCARGSSRGGRRLEEWRLRGKLVY